MSLDPIFVDTWGHLALGHRRDPHHLEVKKFYQGLRDQGVAIYTSDYVLDELVTLLNAQRWFLL
jgi:predicted nucleic acid-binding protein